MYRGARSSGCPAVPFEPADRWRYSLWVTNRPATTRGRAGAAHLPDAAHRAHPQVEDRVRTGKDRGNGKFPSTALTRDKAWLAAALTAEPRPPGPPAGTPSRPHRAPPLGLPAD